MKTYQLEVKDEKGGRFYNFTDNNLSRLFCEHNDYQKDEFVNEKWKRLKLDLKGKSVLDIGCNSGKIGLKCKKSECASYIGFDNNWRYLEDCIDNSINKKDLFLGDLDNIYGFSQGKFDVVLLLATFHYVKADKRDDFIKYMSDITKEMLVFEGPVENGDPDFAPTFKEVEDLLNKYFKRVEFYGESIPPIPNIKKEYSKRFIWKAYKK